MKVKILQNNGLVKVFLDDKEIKHIKSICIEKNQDDFNYFNLTLKIFSGDVEFIGKEDG